jgi:hypothetical protein
MLQYDSCTLTPKNPIIKHNAILIENPTAGIFLHTMLTTKKDIIQQFTTHNPKSTINLYENLVLIIL